MTQLNDILDDWLVHDESCPASWSGQDSSKCDCIAKDQKRNLGKAIVEAVEELIGHESELPPYDSKPPSKEWSEEYQYLQTRYFNRKHLRAELRQAIKEWQ